MELIVYNSWKGDKAIVIDFDSKISVNNGRFNSLGELVTLKKIEEEVREYLGLKVNWRDRYALGLSRTEVYVGEEDYKRIQTIVKRDNIIENILGS